MRCRCEPGVYEKGLGPARAEAAVRHHGDKETVGKETQRDSASFPIPVALLMRLCPDLQPCLPPLLFQPGGRGISCVETANYARLWGAFTTWTYIC